MPAPVIEFYNSADSATVSSISFSDIVPGTPTAATEIHIWNDKGGSVSADDAQNLQMYVLGRFPGDTDYQGEGLELLDFRSIECRVIGVQGTAVLVLTEWTPLGAGTSLPLVDLPSDSAIEVEFRVNAPASVTEAAIEIAVRLESRAYTSLGVGHYLSDRNSIHMGIGDESQTELLSETYMTEQGTPGSSIDVGDIYWIHEGVPFVKLASTLTFNNLDGSAAALAAGEEYLATISLGGSSTITVTKSDKGTAPLPSTSRPDTPTGEILLGYVQVQFDLTINTAEISHYWVLGCFSQYNSGLTMTVGRGQALVDDYYVRRTSFSNVTLTASQTNYVFLNGDGSFGVTTDGSKPTARSLLLYEATTDGSGVTALVDRRVYSNRGMVHFEVQNASGLAVNDYATWLSPEDRSVYIRPGEVLGAMIHDAGTGLTTGNYVFEIETFDGAGSWTTIFTSSGSDDRRPTVAYNAYYDDTALPEVLEIQARTLVRARVAAIPTGTTPSKGATISMPIELYV